MVGFLHGLAAFFSFLIPAAVIMLTVRALTKIPDELFRKILHFILLGAYIPLVFAFEVWWMAAILAAALAIGLYPLLTWAGRIPGFTRFATERKEGEFANSMVLALTTMALAVTVCWGIFGDRYLVLACVYAWGVGDAFAALIGKKFGKHKITWKYADKHKSVEGSAAMFLTSTIAVVCVLLVRGHLPWPAYLVIPVVGAGAASVVEMVCKDGRDTICCPVAAMLTVLPLMELFGGI